MIEEYLKAQNRPHNVNTLVENLRGKVKKVGLAGAHPLSSSD